VGRWCEEGAWTVDREWLCCALCVVAGRSGGSAAVCTAAEIKAASGLLFFCSFRKKAHPIWQPPKHHGAYI
jgi:hypothetical protein